MSEDVKTKRFLLLCVFLMFPVVFIVAFWLLRAHVAPMKDIEHVILISIDTCRADYLSCYGFERSTTPNIDAVASQGLIFENTISPTPLTLPAHSSMLTGTVPPYNGVHDNLGYRLGESNQTIAEILKENGFTTGAIISTFVLDSQFGLDQGFDTYNDKFEESLPIYRSEERRGAEATRLACDWLSKHKDEKSFLFLHYYDPHEKYEPPEPFATTFKDNLYAGEIAYTDDCIGGVIDKLKELGFYDSALIIITSDHGEMLGEHGENSHGYFIYQSAIKVPLIFKLPQQMQSRKVKDLVGLVDIVPTVCSMLGLKTPSEVQGKDLSMYFRKKRYKGPKRHLYCQSMMPTKYNASSLLAVIGNRWKYIQTTRPELYDLSKDLHESNDLINRQPQRGRILQDKLKQMLEETVHNADSSKTELDAETRKRLESLGYIAGGDIIEDFGFDQDKPDSKDLIGLHVANASAIYLISLGYHDQAKAFCEEMLAEDPDYAETYVHLGKIAKSENRVDDAIANFTKCLELDDRYSEAHTGLARLLTKQGRYDEAIEHWKADIALKQCDPETLANLALTLLLQEKYDESIERYLEALRYSPDSAVYHRDIADVYLKQNDLGRAVVHLTESLRLNANQFSVHNTLANVSLRQNNHEKFMLHLAESLRLNPNQPVVHYNMGQALLQQNKLAESVEHFEKVLQLDPDDFDAHNMLAQIFHKQNDLKTTVLHLSKSINIRPDQPAMLNKLAWLKAVYKGAEFYDASEAIRLARRCCELTKFRELRFLDTLAVSYAAAGRFSEAIEISNKAIEPGQFAPPGFVNELKVRLELYKRGKPFHVPIQ